MRIVIMSGAVLAAALSITGCGGGGMGSPDAGYQVQVPGSGSGNQITVLGAINAWRTKCAIPPAGLMVAFNNSAVKHAAYQAAQVPDVSSYTETNTANPFYTAANSSDRMQKAWVAWYDKFVVAPLPPGPTGYDERIHDTLTGTAYVAWAWPQTIYHRLPMMRHEWRWLGYGDRDQAIEDGLAIPATHTFNATTLDWGRLPGVVRSVSAWPTDGEIRVASSYSPADDAAIPPGLTSGKIYGTAIHLIHPTNSQWISISASVTPVEKPVVFPQLPTPTGTALNPIRIIHGGGATSTDTSYDSMLTVGEVFIIPPDALNNGWYNVVFNGATSNELVKYSWYFKVGP